MATITAPKEGIYMVDKQLSSVWLSNFNYEHQRPMRSAHMRGLARMMEEGKFRQKTQIAFVEFAGRHHLTNGQHTLSAIVASGRSQMLDVVVSRAATAEELADDYARHDTHLTRRFADSLVAHECDKALGVNRTQLGWMVAAIQYYAYITGVRSTDSTTQLTHDEKLSLLREYGDLAKSAIDLFEGFQNNTWMTRKSTIAPAMFVYQHQPEMASKFWRTFARDDGLRIGDPRKTLRDWLRDSVTQGASGSRLGLKSFELTKGIAACWNAWVDDRTLRFVRIDRDAQTVSFLRCGAVRVKGAGPFPAPADDAAEPRPSARTIRAAARFVAAQLTD